MGRNLRVGELFIHFFKQLFASQYITTYKRRKHIFKYYLSTVSTIHSPIRSTLLKNAMPVFSAPSFPCTFLIFFYALAHFSTLRRQIDLTRGTISLVATSSKLIFFIFRKCGDYIRKHCRGHNGPKAF